jgi:hypothetical protein
MGVVDGNHGVEIYIHLLDFQWTIFLKNSHLTISIYHTHQINLGFFFEIVMLF